MQSARRKARRPADFDAAKKTQPTIPLTASIQVIDQDIVRILQNRQADLGRQNREPFPPQQRPAYPEGH